MKWWPFCPGGDDLKVNTRRSSLIAVHEDTIFSNDITHHNNVIMSATVSQITDVSIVYSTVCLVTDQRKHQSSASLAFVRGIRRCPVNFPHKGPVTRKMFPFEPLPVILNCVLIFVLLSTIITPNYHRLLLKWTDKSLIISCPIAIDRFLFMWSLFGVVHVFWKSSFK